MNKNKNSPLSNPCIIAYSFGTDTAEKFYGKSNKAIAERIMQYLVLQNLPVIAQWEIAATLCLHSVKVFSISLPEGKTYIDTRHVTREIKRVMESQGFDSVVVFAHPDHLARIYLMLKQEKIAIKEKLKMEIPYDPESMQNWTRSKAHFLPREIVTYLLTFLKLL